MTKRRLLTIGHSYCVALNRRLAHEMARLGGAQWEVTAAAPAFFHGDLRPIALEALPGEQCRLQPLVAHLSRRIHVMFYERRLRALLAQPWDVVHCWEEPYLLAGAQVAWWTPRGAALVYNTAQNIAKRYPPPFNWIERHNLRRASGWVAFGETIVQTLVPQPLYAARARRIIPLGLNTDSFRPDPQAGAHIRQQLGWTKAGPPVIGYLGRFVPDKGVPLLLRVLERVATPWRALFVGGGAREAELRAWAGRYGDRVRVVTGVLHADVPAYLNAMDLLCAPSQTMPHWREQQGRMLSEAFACGVPVVASDSGEIPYVVRDAGVIVGEQDEAGWTVALSELLENPARRAELTRRGLERARTVYAWPTIAQHYLDFFAELLDGARERGRAGNGLAY